MFFEWLEIAFGDGLNYALNIITYNLLVFMRTFVTVFFTSRYLCYKLMNKLLLFLLLTRIRNAKWILGFWWMGRFDQILIALGLF